jgi:hypothetical protein
MDTGSGEEECAICWNNLSGGQLLGRPGGCEHTFCAACIVKWAKSSTAAAPNCPIDRLPFYWIIINKFLGGPKTGHLDVVRQETETNTSSPGDHNYTYCEICELNESMETMIICQCCFSGTHIHCLNPSLNRVPPGIWFCSDECAGLVD